MSETMTVKRRLLGATHYEIRKAGRYHSFGVCISAVNGEYAARSFPDFADDSLDAKFGTVADADMAACKWIATISDKRERKAWEQMWDAANKIEDFLSKIGY